ncbi:uncharacterized protein LOC141773880 isoform X1 [Sebastes fasciatus]|uniref:uncharacterized protein LOC141773880 isoform X1 n=2 Tax=Sebastes fasciatus TaxID=394691 RepID=UPI003D9E8DF3
MSELMTESSGWYMCVRGNLQMPVHLTVTEQPATRIHSMTVSEVSGKAGDSISIPCLYYLQHMNHVKYFCKGNHWSSCSDVVKTNQPSSSGKFSISDDKSRGIFTVTMKDLTDDDTDDYWCAVEIDDGPHDGEKFHLSVTRDTPSLYVDHQEITGYKGYSITINCHYHNPGEIAWCGSSSCVTTSSELIDGTRVTISRSVPNVFTVTMSELRTESSGWYMCAKGNLQMPVHLTVTEPPANRIHTITTVSGMSGKAGDSVTIPCLYDSQHMNHVKYFCKGNHWSSCSDAVKSNQPSSSGKFSVSVDKSRGIFTVTIKDVTDKDADDYWCAVEIDDRPHDGEKFHLSVTRDKPGLYVDHQEITGYKGYSITINCHYHNPGESAWCRGSSCVTTSSGSIDGTRVTISRSVPNVFTVTMSELMTESSGWYMCVKGDLQMPVHVTVNEQPATRIHTITTVSEVSGKAGDSISIPCLYDSQHMNHVKYFCKGNHWSSCSDAVKTNQPSSSGQFSISADKSRGIFTVTMKDLTDKDADDYWCAVEIDDRPHDGEKFHLSVTRDTPGLYVDQQEITGYKGYSITINCHYHNSGESAWCRLGSSCVTTSSGSIDGTRVTISRSVPNVFTVTMSELRTESSGWYWCLKGDLQMPVHVTVTEQPANRIHTITTVSEVSGKAGDSISIPCLYDSQHMNHVKYFCKGNHWSSCSDAVKTNQPSSSGQFSISVDKSRGIFTVTIKDLTDKDADDYWCAVEIDDRPHDGEKFHLSVTRDTPGLYVDHQEITGYKGYSITINCHYHNSGESAWCRLGSSCVTTSSGSIDGTRVTISRSVPNVFTVTMSELRTESSGWYWCLKGDLQMPVHLTVTEQPANRIHTITTVSEVSGKAGDSITIPCLYDSQHMNHVKYFCKGNHWSSCSDAVKSNQPSSSEKFSVSVDKSRGIFTVTIKDVTDKDADDYWCAVEIDDRPHDGEKFHLSVTRDTPGLYVDQQEITGYKGYSITINCHYHNPGESAWCRGSSCVTTSSGSIDGTRVTISRSVPNVFTVTMSELMTESSGWYMCAKGNLQMPVHLTVTEQPANRIHSMTVSEVSGKAGDSISIPCLYYSQYMNHVKYFCKGNHWSSCSDAVKTNQPSSSGKFSISDDKSRGIFTVTMKDLTDKDADDYWCAVEIDDGPHDGEKFHLSVTRDTPSLYVDHQEITGYKGYSITINCHYHNPGEIAWCGGSSCVTTSSGSIDGTRVTISRSVPNVFTVTMSELMTESSGWYMCAKGNLQMPVYLTVTEQPANSKLL